jgi:DNA modification methylase
VRVREGARPFDLGRKQLLGMPWRVAFALQADGWVLRADVVWHKPNPMPESVTDRPTKAHEYVFLLAKNDRYFYDADAIKEATSGTAHSRGRGVNPKAKAAGANSRENVDRVRRPREKQNESWSSSVRAVVASRNARSVWTIAPEPYSGAHFATMAPGLAERCILAGTSPKACERCGAPFRRILGDGRTNTHMGSSIPWSPTTRATIGWDASCGCDGVTGSGRCVVLDPFGGAGTTGLVADRLERDAWLVELNPDYVTLSRERIGDDSPLFARVAP